MAIKLPRHFSMPPSEDEARKALRTRGVEYLGGFGEAVWGNLLAGAGFHCVWLSAIEQGGAPMAYGRNTACVLPDFDVKWKGRGVYVDAKAKTQSIRYRNANNQERHGINQRCWESYQRISVEAGQPCCLAIVEIQRQSERGGLEWSGSLLLETLTGLGEPRSEFIENPRKVYWPRKRFCELDSGLTALELYEIACGKHPPHGYAIAIQNTIHPLKQVALF